MKSNTEWAYWGKEDPLYGAAAWEGREKGGCRPWTEKEFFQLSQSDWADFLIHWQKYGFDPGVCVEIGCGAGCLTRYMVKTFRRLCAIDIAEEMIQFAKAVKASVKRKMIKVGRNAQLMRMNSYESDWLFELLPSLDFADIEIHVFVTKSNNHPHSFVLATRSI